MPSKLSSGKRRGLEYDVAILQAVAYLWSLDMGCTNSYEPMVNLIVYLVVGTVKMRWMT
jgi:hypothetical protein